MVDVVDNLYAMYVIKSDKTNKGMPVWHTFVLYFLLVIPFLPRYLPLVCPLSPLEPHWNLIGI